MKNFLNYKDLEGKVKIFEKNVVDCFVAFGSCRGAYRRFASQKSRNDKGRSLHLYFALAEDLDLAGGDGDDGGWEGAFFVAVGYYEGDLGGELGDDLVLGV